MRIGPALGLLVVIGAAIGVAAWSSHENPMYELPPNEQPDTTATTPATKKPAAKASGAAAGAASSPAASAAAFAPYEKGAIKATLTIQGKAPIVMEFYPKAAPKTVSHITELIKKGFYNGIKVHRVEPGFVVQMGDPITRNLSPDQFSAKQAGSHGSGTTVPLEAKLPNVTDSVGLARSSALNSGDSQFYINLMDNKSLDGGYCVFGRVVSGQQVVPTIAIGDTIQSFTLSGQ